MSRFHPVMVPKVPDRGGKGCGESTCGFCGAIWYVSLDQSQPINSSEKDHVAQSEALVSKNG